MRAGSSRADYILPRLGRQWERRLSRSISPSASPFDRDGVTLVLSLEMDRPSLLDRLICSRVRLDTKKFEGGWLNREESERARTAAHEIIESGRILIDDKATTNVSEIHCKIRGSQQSPMIGPRLISTAYIKMLSEMAKGLGYRRLQQTDIDKFYSPQVYANQADQRWPICGEFVCERKPAHSS